MICIDWTVQGGHFVTPLFLILEYHFSLYTEGIFIYMYIYIWYYIYDISILIIPNERLSVYMSHSLQNTTVRTGVKTYCKVYIFFQKTQKWYLWWKINKRTKYIGEDRGIKRIGKSGALRKNRSLDSWMETATGI